MEEKNVEKILEEYINNKYNEKSIEEKNVGKILEEHINNKDNEKSIEEKGKMLKEKIFSTTQLRLLLSNAVVIKNKIAMSRLKNKDELSEELKNEVKYLLIKHIYQIGRDRKVREFDKKFEIKENLKKIKTKEDYENFYRYLEEIVAYVKYYIG